MAALKVSIDLSSTWELGPESDSKDLKDIFLINKKTPDNDNNEDTKSDDEKSVKLFSSSSSPCFIYIDAKRLSNYTMVGLEVMSSSRNIELYSGLSDTTSYISTGRGTPLKKIKGSNMYRCIMSFEGESLTELSLKFVSVRHQQEALITRLCVSVNEISEDERGLMSAGITSTSHHHPRPDQQIQDMQYLMKEAKTTLPIPQLLSTLQRLQEAPGVATNTDMNQMMSLFRQIHQDKSAPLKDARLKETKINGLEEEENNIDEKDKVINGDTEIEKLETRLKEYIDIKMSELEIKLTEHLTQLIRKEAALINNNTE
ncbi:PREDICTED: uncharacterized protein LOC109593754 [Amphimedon queenslandica]|uniref:Uncharacterized protein n=1 Tax=Amphimedon queenslandica TaxID=400682 RepID=A0A1X7VLD7_AMPQE|nr:PREDICTED: uncharacterized protein LOC109593754 [Amphimedon queenslandica]|eukprot:XP_019864357.1 PREDICTED: uncharacterized protein LOC109593754 [Amphimedon queenslandica]